MRAINHGANRREPAQPVARCTKFASILLSCVAEDSAIFARSNFLSSRLRLGSFAALLALPVAAQDTGVAADCIEGSPRICILADQDASAVLVALTLAVGAADEEPGQSGVAHYVEHLMFRGRVDNDTARATGIDRFGNAHTGHWATTYHWTVPPDQARAAITRALDVLLPMDAGQDEIMQERQIVAREYELAAAEPVWRAWRGIDSHLLAGSPLAGGIIGTPEAIASLDKPAALQFHQRRYRPEAATLIVAGATRGLDVDLVVNLVGPLPTGTRDAVPERLSLDRRLPVAIAGTDRIAGSRRFESVVLRTDPSDIAAIGLLDAWLGSTLSGAPGRILTRGAPGVQDFRASMGEIAPGWVRFDAVLTMRPDAGGAARDAAWSAWLSLRQSLSADCTAGGSVERLAERERRRLARERGDGIAAAWSLIGWIESGRGVDDWRAYPDAVLATTRNDIRGLAARLADPVRSVRLDLELERNAMANEE